MIAAAVLLLIVATTVGLARLKPAAPTVEGGTLWIDSVKRGTMLRQVRGNGVLVPDEIRWVTALTDGRVERLLVQPGTAVNADTVLLELSNPQTEQAALTADLDLRTALAQYEVLKADLARDLLAQRVAAATIDADAAQAAIDARADEAMAKNGFISAIQLQRTRLKAETAAARKKMEAERLANTEKTLDVRLDVQQAEVDRRKAMATLRRSEATGLRIRAGVSGVLQEVAVAVGQRIGPGTNLARVVDPTRLKAQLQIAETQVKDIVIGQKAEVDTRNGITKGRVIRIDPGRAQRHGHRGCGAGRRTAARRASRHERGRHHRARAARQHPVRRTARFRARAGEGELVQVVARSLDRDAHTRGAGPELCEHRRADSRAQCRRLCGAVGYVGVGWARPPAHFRQPGVRD